MIARWWRGSAGKDEADEYLEHLRQAVLPELARIDGYRGAQVLRRDLGDGVEFAVLTLWESMESVRQFAGADAATAVVAPAARRLLRDFDSTVTHYEIVLNTQGRG
jgi:heme-degrading monooxygenase HmoA